MEMTKLQDDWDEDDWDRSDDFLADLLAPDEEPSEQGEHLHVLSRVNGWSVALAVTSNVLLVVLAIATGATLIGMAACGAVGVSSWLLVVAEVLSVRRL
jgi:hypothetical protein